MRVRSFSKAFPVGIGLGILFASFYAVARPDHAAQILAAGALTGAFISLGIHILNSLFAGRIDRLSPRWHVAARGMLYLVGSTAGWLLGMLLSSYLFGLGLTIDDLLRGNFVFTMGVTGTIAVVVGLSFYAFEVLQQRLARTIEQLKEHEWAEKELELARAIQSRLLPPAFVEGNGFAIAARNLPARYVAGDFYDIVRLDDGTIVIVVADVAGKGVGASLIMASVKAVLPFVAREGAQRAMSMLNAKLVGELGKREFVALAYARFNPNDGSLELLNAGFPDPYIVSAEGVRALTALGERLPLGLRRDALYEPLHTKLEVGQRMVFLSDGIPEAPVNGEPLGYERVASILGAMNRELRGEAWLDAFLGDVRSSVDAGLDDDWTAVVLERTRISPAS
jgi:serine phosphatase RsbU (regulator of sigma subunit)